MKMEFFKFYWALLGGYLNYYTRPLSNTYSIGNQIFNMDSYINSIETNNKEFMKKFITTQQFMTFIERSYQGLSSPNEVTYFIKSSKIVSNEQLNIYLKRIYTKILKNYINVRFHIQL